LNLQLPLLASLLRLLTTTTSTTTRATSAALVVRTRIASQWEASPRVLVRRDSLGSPGTVVQTPSTAVSELLRAVLRRTGPAAPPIMCAFATFAFRDVAVIQNALLESVASRTRRSRVRARRCASRSASTTRTVSPESTARRTSAGPAVGATPTAHSARFARMGLWEVRGNARRVATSTMTALLSRSAEEGPASTPATTSPSAAPTRSATPSTTFPLVDVQRATKN